MVHIYLLGAVLLGLCFTSTTRATDGSPVWTNLFTSAGNNNDVAQSLAVDGSGNIYVTGYSFGSGSGYDYATLKYSSTGIPLWTNRFNGPGNGDDEAQSLVVDGSGNVYVTGYSYNGTNMDYVTLKYSNAGTPQWTNCFNSTANNEDLARSLTVDGSGNIYVTGYSFGSGSGYDFATLKYSSTGIPLWTNRFNGAGNNNDVAQSLAVDGSGNVYVTGYSFGSGSGYDYATLKYSSTGIPLWTNRFNGPGNGDDYARSLVVDGSGNVYVTGYSYGSGSGYDYGTLKYSSAGIPLWTNRFNGTANRADFAQSLVMDGSGNVYVTGSSYGGPNGSDFATLKYSSDGILLWTNLYNGAGNSADETRCLALDGSGNVYVTGYSTGSGSGYDYVTLKYSGLPSNPPFIAAALLTGGNMRLSFVGLAGTNYVLDRTFNLSPPVNWVPQVTNPAGAGGVLVFTNTPVATTNNFWRFRSVP